jgi:hypothetical protein
VNDFDASPHSRSVFVASLALIVIAFGRSFRFVVSKFILKNILSEHKIKEILGMEFIIVELSRKRWRDN